MQLMEPPLYEATGGNAQEIIGARRTGNSCMKVISVQAQ